MKRIQRRAFLRSIGAGAALLPLLEADFARAQTRGPKRLVIVYKTNGTVLEQFFPAQAGPLTTLPEITKPLEPYKSDLLFLGALQIKPQDDQGMGYAGHDVNQGLMTGLKGKGDEIPGPSIDQLIAGELIKKVSTPRRSLELGAMVPPGKDAHQMISFRGAGQPNTPETDPWKLVDSLFGGAAPAPATGGMVPPPTGPTRAQRRASVLDHVRRDLTRYTKTVGAADRQKIEGHLDSIREIERGLQLGAAGTTTPGAPAALPKSCGKPMLPAKVGVDAWSKTDAKNYPVVLRAQMDLLVSALCADTTRVATLMMTDTFGSNLVPFWLTGEAGPGIAQKHYHDLTHDYPKDAEATRLKAIMERWFMEQVAHLIGRLKAIPEGNGTMLDNTAVVLLDPMGNGSVHRIAGLPVFIAGSCGGYFKTGRYLKYGEFGSKGYDARYKFVPHNGLLVGLCNAMDVPREVVGDPAYGTGELPGLRG